MTSDPSPASDFKSGGDSRAWGLPTRLLRPIARALIAAGGDHHAWLASQGLTWESLDPGEERIPHAAAMDALQAAQRMSGDPAFGLAVGAGIQLEDIGLLGQLVLTAASLREGLMRTQRFGRLLHDASRARYEEKDGKCYLYLAYSPVEMSVTAWEATLGGVVSRTRAGMSPDWSPSEVWFPYAAPAHRDAYDRLFRCDLRFDADGGCIVIDASVADQQGPRDLAISDLIERRAQAALASIGRPASHSAQVLDVLGRGLGRGEVGADHVARTLGMSRATLARRLAAEGTSLRELLDDLRRQLALEYIRDPAMCLDELAGRLAFSDARSLRRAFIRWTGQTPQEARSRPRD